MVTAEQVRALVRELPEAVEIETWGHPTFRVRDKMFAAMSAEGDGVTVKALPDEQDALIQMDGATFGVAPYVGRYGWVSVRLARVEPALLRRLLVTAWRRTAPKRLVQAHDAQLSRRI